MFSVEPALFEGEKKQYKKYYWFSNAFFSMERNEIIWKKRLMICGKISLGKIATKILEYTQHVEPGGPLA